MAIAPDSWFCYFQGIFVSYDHASLVKVTVQMYKIGDKGPSIRNFQ